MYVELIAGERRRKGPLYSVLYWSGYLPTSHHAYSNCLISLSQNRKPCKVTIHKDADGLGMKLMGGKGSRFGDLGIFVAEIVSGSAADRSVSSVMCTRLSLCPVHFLYSHTSLYMQFM